MLLNSLSFSDRSVTKRVWSPPQRPFRVCCHSRETRKGVTAGTLEELKEKVRATVNATKTSGVCLKCSVGVDGLDCSCAVPHTGVPLSR